MQTKKVVVAKKDVIKQADVIYNLTISMFFNKIFLFSTILWGSINFMPYRFSARRIYKGSETAFNKFISYVFLQICLQSTNKKIYLQKIHYYTGIILNLGFK